MLELITSGPESADCALELLSVRVDAKGTAKAIECLCGDQLRIELVAQAHADVRSPNIGYAINMESGELVYSEGVLNHGTTLSDLKAGDVCRAVFRVPVALAPGTYFLTVNASDNFKAASGDSGKVHDMRQRVAKLVILLSDASRRFDGIGTLPYRIRSRKLVRASSQEVGTGSWTR